MPDKKMPPQGGRNAVSSFDAGELIAEIEKIQREIYRVIRQRLNGRELVDVRVCFDNPETDEPRPGEGESIKAEVLPEIVEAPQRAMTKGCAQ